MTKNTPIQMDEQELQTMRDAMIEVDLQTECRKRIEMLQRTLVDVLKRVEDPMGCLNRLGELQGNPGDLDARLIHLALHRAKKDRYSSCERLTCRTEEEPVQLT